MRRQWMIFAVSISGMMLLISVGITVQWRFLIGTPVTQIDPVLYFLPNLIAVFIGVLCARLWITRRILERELLVDIRARHELVARKNELELLNEDLTSFARALAHDLMAPVRVMRGFSEELCEISKSCDQSCDDYPWRIRRSAERMDAIINGVMQLCGVRRMKMSCRQVDISALAQEISNSMVEAEPDRRVVVDIQEGMEVHADEAMLGIVILNLLGNAWKFTAGRDPALIRVKQREDGVIEVIDNGVGFRQEHSEEIFQAFTRCHAKDRFEGSGIGLSTVQRVVDRHGGRVWADSSEGGGAAFFVQIPACTG